MVERLGIKEKTISWLQKYAFTDKPSKVLPSKEVIKELSKYKMTRPERLYRGIRKGEAESEAGKKILSFTSDREVAKLHAREGGKVVSRLVKPEETLIDSRRLPSEELQRAGFMPEEEEIIVISKAPSLFPKAKQLFTKYKKSPLIGLTIEDVSLGGRSIPPVFRGFTNLTTKILNRLTGKSMTSKQEILDFTNMPEVRQAEKDLIRKIVGEFKDQRIPVKEFANKVNAELLPLKTGNFPFREPRYESFALSDEMRGPVANYFERIYESPIKTSAGKVHFGDIDVPNYFAHTRVEDMAATKVRLLSELKPGIGMITPQGPVSRIGNTRRVIEIQSDLFQKGALAAEEFPLASRLGYTIEEIKPGFYILKDRLGHQIASHTDKAFLEKEAKRFYQDITPKALKELGQYEQLQSYRNTWWERIVKEEVKQAAIDKKTKLQFPTGETAMKVEGLGETRPWYRGATELTPDTLKAGIKISTQRPALQGHDWIITDVLGEGRFKAVTTERLSTFASYIEKKFPTTKQLIKTMREQGRADLEETFDISGKIDTSNPIYRFYEKEVGKYLTNKLGANRITDPQGVSWWEIDVPAIKAKLPIEAFSIAPLLYLLDKNETR